METELMRAETQAPNQPDYKEREAASQQVSLEESLAALDYYGGMRLVKTLIRETENLDPRRKGLHDIFLSDPLYKDARKQLSKTLDLWIDFLEKDFEDVEQTVAYCQKENQQIERSISDNLFTVREEIKELEKTYRVLDSFFANANVEKTDFLNLININKSEIGEMDSNSSKSVIKELDDKYDSLNLRESYSLFVLPGYVGSARQIQDWASVAHRNKVLLVTDFEDSMTYEDLLVRLEKSDLLRPHRDNSSVVVACNYIIGRRRSELSTEEEDLYIPPSGAIAGRMTDVDNISISQGVAGRRYGCLYHAPAVRFELLKSELTKLIDMGVVPLLEIDGQVMAFSNRTPYEGSTMELQEYPIVRVFDWVSKVIQQFCNDEAFVIWDATVKSEMVENIQSFLSKYKGAGKLYENYSIKGVNRDPETGYIHVQVELKPFFAAKNFLIELTGMTDKGKMTMKWKDNLN
jgi:hypothetical protein